LLRRKLDLNTETAQQSHGGLANFRPEAVDETGGEKRDPHLPSRVIRSWMCDST
jgi:hypothetical protein